MISYVESCAHSFVIMFEHFVLGEKPGQSPHQAEIIAQVLLQ